MRNISNLQNSYLKNRGDKMNIFDALTDRIIFMFKHIHCPFAPCIFCKFFRYCKEGGDYFNYEF